MAGNIKGIIVEIGGDTSGLQKALKSVNSATASLSKELRGINSLLKLDPKNTELLAQKQTVLKEAITQTKFQLEQLKTAQKMFVDSGGDLNSENYRSLQRDIAKTEAELRNLKIEASNWTKASQELDNLGNKFKNLGNTISNIGKKVSTLSVAVGGLFVAGVKYTADIERYTTAFKTFLGSAEEATEAIQKIKEESKTSPFSTADIIEANQMLITTGVNADEARKTISALSDAIALTGGDNNTLSRMAANLQQIKNIGKASSIDIRQFGMAGIDIYGILADYTGKTTAEIKEMDITYEELAKALQKASSEGGKYYGGQIEMANTLTGQTSQLKKSFQDLIGELSEGLVPIIKNITSKIQKLVDWTSNLSDEQKGFITKIGLIIAALGPALIVIGKLISAGGTIMTVLSKVSGIIAKVVSSAGGLSGVLSALTGPIGIAIAVIAALSAAFVYLFKTNTEFKEKVIETWNGIVDLFNSYVMPVFNSLKELAVSVIASLMDWLKKLWEYVEPAINTMLTWLLDFWNNTLKDIVENMLVFIQELIDIVTMIWNNVISPIVDFLIKTLGPVFKRVFDEIWSKVSGVFQMIGSVIKMLTGQFRGLAEFISGVFKGDWEKAWNGVQKVFKSFAYGLWDIIKVPLNWIIDGINNLIRGLNHIQVPDWVPNVGGKGINIPEIPRLAKGGIIDKATLAMIGEGNSAEAVIPLDRTLTQYMAEAMQKAKGIGTINVNFYPQKMDESELEYAFNYIDRRFGLSY